MKLLQFLWKVINTLLVQQNFKHETFVDRPFHMFEITLYFSVVTTIDNYVTNHTNTIDLLILKSWIKKKCLQMCNVQKPIVQLIK